MKNKRFAKNVFIIVLLLSMAVISKAQTFSPISVFSTDKFASPVLSAEKSGEQAQTPSNFTQQTRRISGNNGDNYANTGVGISGNTAIVASDAGVYVYVRSGNSWSQQTLLIPSDGLSGCPFPRPVAVEGDTVVVGCSSTTINGNTNQGAAYVFVRSGTMWTQQQRLTASDGTAQDSFGNRVAISGETIIVGAPQDSIGANTFQGSAYIFVRNGSVWTEQTKLLAEDGAANNSFGFAVAIDGNTAVVSRLRRTNASIINPAVYVFVRNGSTWQQQQRLSVCEPSASDFCNFGRYGIAVKGDILAVGNDFLNVGANTGQGGVYIFSRSGSTWTQQPRLTAADGLSNDYFGAAVGISGQTLVVGANADLGVPGKAYIYNQSGNQWTFQQKLQPNMTRDAFGQNLFIEGNSLIVAAPVDIFDPPNSTGAAYIFTQPATTVTHTSFDFDGDSRTDVAIFRPVGATGAEWWYLRSSDQQVGAFGFGAPTDIPVPYDFTGDGKADVAFFRPSTAEWFVLRSEDFTFFAFPFGAPGDVPAPGDFDGDGTADPAVYRPSSGTWFILRSSDSGVTAVPFGIAEDKPTVADFDGDGMDDVAVFRPSVNQWWQLRSTAGVLGIQFGSPGDRTAVGDYTGDGKADTAFYRPSTSEWFVIRSEDSSFFAFPWGAAGDVPAPGDYDGDGVTDAAVFRPSDTTWYIPARRRASWRSRSDRREMFRYQAQ